MVADLETRRNQILETICRVFHVTPELIRGRGRTNDVFIARCVYSYLVRHYVGDTHEQIASFMNKNQSVVSQQMQRMNDMIFLKEPAAMMMKEIEQEIVKTLT